MRMVGLRNLAPTTVGIGMPPPNTSLANFATISEPNTPISSISYCNNHVFEDFRGNFWSRVTASGWNQPHCVALRAFQERFRGSYRCNPDGTPKAASTQPGPKQTTGLQKSLPNEINMVTRRIRTVDLEFLTIVNPPTNEPRCHLEHYFNKLLYK